MTLFKSLNPLPWLQWKCQDGGPQKTCKLNILLKLLFFVLDLRSKLTLENFDMRLALLHAIEYIKGIFLIINAHQKFTFSKLIMETPEKCVKFVQNLNKVIDIVLVSLMFWCLWKNFTPSSSVSTVTLHRQMLAV